MDKPYPNNDLGKPSVIRTAKSKKPIYIALVLVILVILILSLTYKGLLTLPNFWPQEKDPLLATVDSKNIYLSQVQKKTDEIVVKSAINKQVLQNTLDNLIEQAILDIESQKFNIQVTNQEIAQKVTQQKNLTENNSS